MDEILSPIEIERLATGAGITLAELCRRAEISYSTFYRWRETRTTPSIDVYARLLKALRTAQQAAA
jgi:transcriptional regulator with XRE-family HTH domain